MSTYGFTEMEARAVGPRTIRITRKKVDWAGVAGYVLLFALLTGLLGEFVVIPMIPVAHAQEKAATLSDRDQEKEYCTEFATQEKPVIGGTQQQIIDHCSRFTS